MSLHSLKEQQTIETSGAQETYAKVIESGVKGRTLVVFDRHSGFSARDYRYRGMGAEASAGTTAPIDAANMVSQLAHAGAVRSVIVIVPESVWGDLFKTYGKRWDSFTSAAGFISRRNGVPVLCTTSDKVKSLRGEKAVVLILGENRGSYSAATLQKWTDPAVSDLVLIQRGRTK